VREERNEKEAALASTLLTLAHRDWIANDLAAARKRLGECPAAYRDAQWRYLERACNGRLAVLPGESGNYVQVRDLAWSPDSKLLAAVYMGPVRVWNVESLNETFRFRIDQTPPIRQLAFASNNLLVTVGSPFGNPLRLLPVEKEAPFYLDIRRWDMTTGGEISGFTVPCQRTLVHLSSDGQRMAHTSYRQLKVMDLAIGPTSARSFDAKAMNTFSKRNAISRDGQFFAFGTANGPVLVRDTRSGAEVGVPIEVPDNVTHLVAFSPDSNHLAISFRQPDKGRESITVRNLHTGREITSFTGHPLGLECIAFDADGTRIVAGGQDKSVIMWDARTGRELMTMRGQDSNVSAVAFSPDNSRLAVGCLDGRIHLWDARPIEDR